MGPGLSPRTIALDGPPAKEVLPDIAARRRRIGSS